MLRNLSFIFTLFSVIIISSISGCSDKLDADALSGRFQGEFIYVTESVTKTGQAEVSFSGNTFAASGNSNRIPAGGSGNYEILKDDLLLFNDKNVWTADFDWNLILSGKYKYQIKQDSLILTRYIEPCINCSTVYSLYQYKLKRIN